MQNRVDCSIVKAFLYGVAYHHRQSKSIYGITKDISIGTKDGIFPSVSAKAGKFRSVSHQYGVFGRMHVRLTLNKLYRYRVRNFLDCNG